MQNQFKKEEIINKTFLLHGDCNYLTCIKQDTISFLKPLFHIYLK